MEQNESCTCPICKQEVKSDHGLTVTQHLTRAILEGYSEMQGAGEFDNVLPCPRCGEDDMSTNVLQNALSRYFDIYVCDVCGSIESVAWANRSSQPLESWWAVKALLKRDNRPMKG